MDEFKAKEVMELTGVPKARLGPWVAAGAIVPLKKDFRRGGVSIYSRQNLAEVLICKELSNHSLPVRTIVDVLGMMRDFPFSNKKDGTDEEKNAWERLEKTPAQFLCLAQCGSTFGRIPTNIPDDAPDAVYKEAYDKVFKLFYGDTPKNGKNAIYVGAIIKSSDLEGFIENASSTLIINLKPILEKAGMIKE